MLDEGIEKCALVLAADREMWSNDIVVEHATYDLPLAGIQPARWSLQEERVEIVTRAAYQLVQAVRLEDTHAELNKYRHDGRACKFRLSTNMA